MRTRASMGKMVNKLTRREKSDAFLMIDRIARGVSHPYTKEFVPTVVAHNEAIQNPYQVRENPFRVAEQNKDNVVVMRQKSSKSAAVPKMVFPDVFYEYFEIVENQPQKVG